MSKVNELAEYLVGENSFLLSDSNNGKTIMLSGGWGAGKTHFWKNNIEVVLRKKLLDEKSACVYVSLYGKDTIEAIKNEILYKAYLFQNANNDLDKVTSKAVSAFGVGARVLSSLTFGGMNIVSSELSSSIENIFEQKKIEEAEKYINNGGVICLDDFERKSVKIDLNDLFGFISQLSIEMNCKIIIILNSDAFEGDEKNTFKKVKEKTINKYFSYSPTIDELFEVVFSNGKYNNLNDHRSTILEVIRESKELNARIYIQVLDNCLEWIEKKNSLNCLRSLVLSSINFIKNNFIFDIIRDENGREVYKICTMFSDYVEIDHYLKFMMEEKNKTADGAIQNMRSHINKKKEETSARGNNNTRETKPDKYYDDMNKKFNNNIDIFKAIYFYGYGLKLNKNIGNCDFSKVNSFVSSGILL